MKRLISLVALLALISMPLIAQEAEPRPERVEPAPVPQVEVAFVLDTTGSMSGLIQSAKDKIWEIANIIATGKPTPELRIALVGYRDKGDAYVTKIHDLNDDLDAVFAKLQEFGANGGGDTPENVLQAMHEASTKLSWSEGDHVLKIMYLVGDCPPHTNYEDVPTLEEICETTVRKNIIINTVRCGGNPTTEKFWKQIARLSEGEYTTIAQDGGTVTIATPFDEELGRLSDELGDTAVAYGDAGAVEGYLGGEDKAKDLGSSTKAARAGAKANSRRVHRNDLVDAVSEGRVDLEEVEEDELPEEMQQMNKEERQQFVQKTAEERAAIKEKIKELTSKRNEYIKKEQAKKGDVDGFDGAVMEALKKQAESAGIEYGD